ncbi:hypothetical protein JTB14_036737, partial [Gonioctena quinquepunctata]
ILKRAKNNTPTPRPFPQGLINISPKHNPPVRRSFTNQQVYPQNVWATRNNPNNPSTSQQPKVKAISGNLDQDDAEKYDSAISTLQRNQVNVIQQMNRHVSPTTKLIENFNATVNLITHNQEVIASEIEKVRSELNTFVYNFNDYMITRNILDQLSLPLQTTLQLLTDLENAITFARINTLHNIHPKEEIKPIHLEKIPLDELHKLHDIQDHMTPLFYEQDSDYTHLWTTPVYIAIAASVGISCFKYYHCLPCQKKATMTPPSEPPVLFVPYKTSSGDGEVTK